MRKFLFVITGICLLSGSCVKDRFLPSPQSTNVIIPSGDSLIHYWNFNGTSITAPTYTIGGGSLSFDFTTVSGTTGYADLLSPVTPTVNLNAQKGDSAGNALRVRNPCLDFIINAPTSGYKNIIISFSVAKSSSGASTDSVYYTTDGINYSNLGLTNVTFNPNVDPDYTLQSFDFRNINAVNNNPKFKIKITFSNGNLATSGNNRFDNITVFAESMGFPSITSAATAAGTVDSAFTYTITATNNPTSYNAVNLPTGLSINSTTGVISGIPKVAGTFIDTIKATNSAGTTSKVLTLTINPAVTISLLHYWNFNNTASLNSLITPNQTIGGGVLFFNFATVSGTTGYYDSLVPSPTVLNARNSDVAGALLRIRNPSTDFIITAPTTGYRNIVVSFAVAISSTTSAPLTDSVYYSTDGVNFINTGLSITKYSPSVDPSYTIQSFDLSSIAAINNNSKFKFRIAFFNGNLNNSGNTRIDNLTVEGYKQ